MEAKEFFSRLESMRKPPREEASFAQGAAQGTAETLLGNAMGFPEITAKGVMNAGQLARYGMGYRDSPFREGGGLLAPSGIDWPTGREAAAGIDTALGAVGLDGLLGVSPNYSENIARRDQVASDAPIGNVAGNIMGDVGTVFTGRAPPLMQGKAGGIFDEGIEKGIDSISQMLGKKAGDTGVVKAAKDVIDSDAVQATARGLGRAGETGTEALVLAALKGGDPVGAAAISAGTQMGASLLNTSMDHVFDILPEMTGDVVKRPKTLPGKVGVLASYGIIGTGVYNALQQLSPGDNSEAFATEASYNKLMGIMMGAFTLGLTGRRSDPDGIASSLPLLADFANSIPRTAMTGFVADMDDELSMKTLERINQAPDSFKEGQIDKLLKGFETGKFSETVNDLYENDKVFFEIISAPDPRLAGVPISGD